jgi:hypothetical protein
VAVLGVIIVARPVEIGRHHRDEVDAVLAPIGLAQLDAGDLGDRVPLIGRLERSGEHLLLAHGLWRKLGIDAGRAEKHQLGDAGRMGGLDAIERDGEIVGNEVRRIGRVGMNAADPCGRQEHGIGLVRDEPALCRILTGEIERVALGGDHLATLRLQAAHQRRADHAAVAGDEDALAGEIEQQLTHAVRLL